MSSDWLLSPFPPYRFNDPQRVPLLPISELPARSCRIPYRNIPGCPPAAGSFSLLARSTPEAYSTLDFLGGGVMGSGFGQTYLGQTMMPLRDAYYRALAKASEEILERQRQLGTRLNNPAVKREFVAWASARRQQVARLYRIPHGPGAMLGGEIRDIREYGWGGRSMSNLERRQLVKRGLVGDAALNAILDRVDTPNERATIRAGRAARVLRGGGAILIVGGAALTGYEIYQARPEDRPFIIKRAAVTTAASTAGTVLMVGLAVMLGATGVGLIAVGLVAGIAAGYGAERVFFAERDREVQALQRTGIVDGRALVHVGGR